MFADEFISNDASQGAMLHILAARIRNQQLPSQNWRTFLDSHIKSMVSADFFTMPALRSG